MSWNTAHPTNSSCPVLECGLSSGIRALGSLTTYLYFVTSHLWERGNPHHCQAYPSYLPSLGGPLSDKATCLLSCTEHLWPDLLKMGSWDKPVQMRLLNWRLLPSLPLQTVRGARLLSHRAGLRGWVGVGLGCCWQEDQSKVNPQHQRGPERSKGSLWKPKWLSFFTNSVWSCPNGVMNKD